jgi:cell division protein FtsZ
MADYKINESNNKMPGAVIKVIGVGGGGGNMINHMIEKGVKDIELIAANTDAQALSGNKAPIKIHLGQNITKGLGAGANPEQGKKAAEESTDEIKKALDGADLVFIAAGMGGGTGTGAAPVIAKIAKELGALTIGVVTKPFRREGGKRKQIAEIGFNELRNECDSIVTILNQKLLSIIDRKASIKDSYRMVDDVLYQAVTGISNMIISYGENDINVDFADLKKVMSHKGMALMGIGRKSGEHSAKEALIEAIESPLLDETDINDAKGLLIHFTLNENYPLVEIEEAMEEILGEVSQNVEVDMIEGQTTNNELGDDEIIVTIVATGFDENKSQNNISTPKQKETPRLDVDVEALTRKKVVGGNDLGIELSGDELDKPAYQRLKRD